MSDLIPIVVEKGAKGERAYDLYSRLMKERILFCKGHIEPNMANTLVASLLYLENDSKTKPINMYIQSPGGVVTAGLAIYDTMQFVRCPVTTVVIGEAASMASVIATAGEPGNRFVLNTARTMVHQPSSGFLGQVSDMQIHAEEGLRLKNLLNEIYKRHNTAGLTGDEIERMLDRDRFLTAEETVKYGFADHVITSRDDLK